MADDVIEKRVTALWSYVACLHTLLRTFEYAEKQMEEMETVIGDLGGMDHR